MLEASLLCYSNPDFRLQTQLVWFMKYSFENRIAYNRTQVFYRIKCLTFLRKWRDEKLQLLFEMILLVCIGPLSGETSPVVVKMNIWAANSLFSIPVQVKLVANHPDINDSYSVAISWGEILRSIGVFSLKSRYQPWRFYKCNWCYWKSYLWTTAVKISVKLLG